MCWLGLKVDTSTRVLRLFHETLVKKEPRKKDEVKTDKEQQQKGKSFVDEFVVGVALAYFSSSSTSSLLSRSPPSLSLS